MSGDMILVVIGVSLIVLSVLGALGFIAVFLLPERLGVEVEDVAQGNCQCRECGPGVSRKYPGAAFIVSKMFPVEDSR